MEISNPDHKKLRLTRTIKLDKGDPEVKRQEILDYFNNTFSLYERLFDIINNHKSYYIKAEPLRHPLIFYYGHTATFFVNKFTLGGYLKERINPKFESMFAVGVDEMDWDDLNESHYEWPSVDEVTEYRKKVREVISQKIKDFPISTPINWESPFWTVMMGIEHERIHLETSSVIMRRLPIEEVHDEVLFPICPETNFQGYDSEGNPKVNDEFPKNELLSVEEGDVDTGKKDGLYGWDNEFGIHKAHVPAFNSSKYLVSNYDYLQFMLDGGYENQEYWTEEGWKWNRSTKMTRPLFWIPDQVVNGKQTYKFRTMTKLIDMPWDWPVETNNLESKAYCNWYAKKTGKSIRLPTEDEWYRLRDMIKTDLPDWEFGSVGNVNLEAWASSCPINKFETNGFYDIVGNVWQHTETPFDGFDGFKIHPLYDDFSTPCFDTKHNMIKGGSWITTGNEAIYHARYAFRRHFYQHAGFRYVESETPVVIRNNNYETDKATTQYLEFHYGKEYLGIENFQKKSAQICAQVCKDNGVELGRALDLGCAVGRTTYELVNKGFEEAVGLDLSSRFFQLAVKLKEEGKIRYALPVDGEIVEFKEIHRSDLGYDEIKDNVIFFQQDVCNLDTKKFNSFNLVFAGNLIESLKYPKRLLKMVHNLLTENGILVITNNGVWDNGITEKEQQVGGFKKDAENFTTYDGLKMILSDNFNEIKTPHDVEYIYRETPKSFQHSFTQFTYWQKKSN
jgi:5-histidylcysteine sulfoxide synthase/putative 4-mercaptohistidine N1-methyltranferase